MDDEQLFPKLASMYQIGALRKASRRPPRAYGFPGLITLEPEQGNSILVKQVNSDSRPMNGSCQRDVTFQARCVSVGLAAPLPVMTSDKLHGSVEDEEEDQLHRYQIFTAEQFISGNDLADVRVGKSTARNILHQAGTSAALLRVASRQMGSWDFYPLLEQRALQRLVTSAKDHEMSWVDKLAELVKPLSKAAAALPLDSRRSTAFIAPLDFAPKDAMLTKRGRLVFTDWERTRLVDSPNPLFDCTDAWVTWAVDHGVAADEAHADIDRAFKSTLGRHPEVAHTDSSPETDIKTLLSAFLTDSAIAVSPHLSDGLRKKYEESAGAVLKELEQPAIAIADRLAQGDHAQKSADYGLSN